MTDRPERRAAPNGPLVLASLILALSLGCATRVVYRPVEPVRISEVAPAGDAVRRASLRLCVEGLRADEDGRSARARIQYERAIQIDPTNPWAYLSLARHEVERGEPDRALEYLQQADSLLRAESALSPGVEPHLIGLRGAALQAEGRGGGADLERAAQLSPEVWGDGRLTASELR